MQAAPQVAMELPLKILVWADDDGDVWITYITGEFLAKRYGIRTELVSPLSAPETFTSLLLDI